MRPERVSHDQFIIKNNDTGDQIWKIIKIKEQKSKTAIKCKTYVRYGLWPNFDQ
jgi:uncharacterized protein (DUF2249 family)